MGTRIHSHARSHALTITHVPFPSQPHTHTTSLSRTWDMLTSAPDSTVSGCLSLPYSGTQLPHESSDTQPTVCCLDVPHTLAPPPDMRSSQFTLQPGAPDRAEWHQLPSTRGPPWPRRQPEDHDRCLCLRKMCPNASALATPPALMPPHPHVHPHTPCSLSGLSSWACDLWSSPQALECSEVAILKSFVFKQGACTLILHLSARSPHQAAKRDG